MASAIRARRGKGFAALLHAVESQRRHPRFAGGGALEPGDQSLPVYGLQLHKISQGVEPVGKCEVHTAVSAAATTTTALGGPVAAKAAPKVSAWKNLRGLFPYLKRYTG